MMYAIKNKKYNKWLFGTDYRCSPRRQRLSNDRLLVFDDYKIAETELKIRGCGKEYAVVPIEVIEKKGR